ncbi:MAG: MurR/RpiR family transcriptional regulator [Deltaproteobacteria bacterium]|nr:MurR/RpiR family transcriptional regulator [Deltaproteobacteria bacterium]MBW1930195.1 MurR/RpiR family transcriptional regulator [Deltaproteobacteria bacterium]MBW2025488.1 MurR/RpiR family transcriptional regulator [Deltaproteobacteria bacterium]MBW2124980.1 MurR/RpiR family transcriptional regulator [Deltaproteobacteria bacterium]RLB23492.1 MAG: MurR/RpiR family transcriptional regulator [Deltaproteobacteria bacterium]
MGHPFLERLEQRRAFLTPKGQILADFVKENPRQAVFMTTRQLGQAAGVSEATVVRFVDRLGYRGYADFIRDLRELVDTQLTLIDRVALTKADGPGAERLFRVVEEEIANLKEFYETADYETIGNAARLLLESTAIYVIGSRLSYTFAYYLGWSLTKIRGQVHILSGSDSTSIDWLTIAPKDSLVVIFATSRYPNELIRLARLVRRLEQKLLVVSDSTTCPVNQFADLHIVVRCLHFPVIGSPSLMACLVNCLTLEMIARGGDTLKAHQEKLEQAYRENDVLFNLDGPVI